MLSPVSTASLTRGSTSFCPVDQRVRSASVNEPASSTSDATRMGTRRRTEVAPSQRNQRRS